MSPKLFAALAKILNQLSVESLKSHDDSFALLTGQQTLLEMNEASIKLAGKIELSNKLIPNKPSQKHDVIESTKLQQFFQALTPSTIRLNHLGIGYNCPDITKEIEYYQAHLKDSSLNLYEESSDSPYTRWLFVGDRTNWQEPLFELVLTNSNSPQAWKPHFQIDLDTKLTLQKLEELTDKYLRKDFFSWKLDIPSYGVVLAMGRLAEVNGTEIYLGLGTNLRNTKMHREQILKDM